MSASSARTVVVTGGATGIGREISTTLADAGWRVAIWDRTSPESPLHDRILSVTADVTEPTSLETALRRTEREIGPIDALVNNAGIDHVGPFVESTPHQWDDIVSVNLLGAIRCTRLVLDGMVERSHGRIVFIASDAGKVGGANEAVYSASKGGVIAFAKALAREVASSGLLVNSVCPGPVQTALLRQLSEHSSQQVARMTRAIPLGRVGHPSDVAALVGFLLSDGANYITGQAWSVSGGLTMI